jgi:NAD+ diphosphatase
MPPDRLGFTFNPLDRAANHRADKAWLDAMRRGGKARLIRLNGDRVRLADGHVEFGSPKIDSAIFLGLDSAKNAWFAEESGIADGTDLRSIAVGALVPPEELGLLAQARSLLVWHSRRSFCSNCGARTEVQDGGYRRHCPACQMDHFPRTDPVVIMVAIHDGACLLGRQKSWAPGMYSALAGFMEPGETIEDAARREIFEEAGISIGAVHYIASQPWPFPSSLMIGLLGEAETSDIKLDHQELEDARWFQPAEVRAMLAGTHSSLRCPPPMAIANHLLESALKRCAAIR